MKKIYFKNLDEYINREIMEYLWGRPYLERMRNDNSCIKRT